MFHKVVSTFSFLYPENKETWYIYQKLTV